VANGVDDDDNNDDGHEALLVVHSLQNFRDHLYMAQN